MYISPTLSGFERRLIDLMSARTYAADQNRWRLATGKRISTPRDDPSAFITLSGLESEAHAVNSALSNVTAASHVVSRFQEILGEVRSHLNTIRDKSFEDIDGLLSDEQRAANQAAIDTAIAEINRLAATEINGRRPLDGIPVIDSDTQVSGVNAIQVVDFQVDSIEPSATETISGTVTSAATEAELTYRGRNGGRVRRNATFDLSGNLGSTTISVRRNERLTAVRDRINQESAQTGVVASVSGNEIILNSSDVGSAAQIAVDVTSGRFDVTGGNGDGTANGTAGKAAINGQTLTEAGNEFTLSTAAGTFSLTSADGFVGAFDPITVTNSHSISAAETTLNFALSPDLSRRSTLTLSAVNTYSLGGPTGMLDQLATGGTLAGLGSIAADAVRVVDDALQGLTQVEGRVNAFADITIASAGEHLSSMRLSVEDSMAQIDSVNVAEETALLARNQLLADHAQLGLFISLSNRQQLVTMLLQNLVP